MANQEAPITLLQVAFLQVRAGLIGVGQIGLAKAAAREVALGETDTGEIGYIEVASADASFGLRHLAAERMSEVGAAEPRAEQIASIQLNREQPATIEAAKRQVASQQTNLAQYDVTGFRVIQTDGSLLTSLEHGLKPASRIPLSAPLS